MDIPGETRFAGGLAAGLMPLAIAVVLGACGRSGTPATASSSALPPPASPSSMAIPPTSSPVAPTASRQPTATAPEPFAVVLDAGSLVGTWKFSDRDYMRFYVDGTVHEADSLEQLDGEPFAVNRFEFDGDRLVLRELSVSGVPPCGGDPARYEARLLQSGRLQLVDVRDACAPRAGDVRGIYERVP